MIVEIAAAAIAGGMVGFFACAVMTAGKVGDEQLARLSLWEAQSDHDRVADTLATKTARIDRALEQITPRANATVQRIARILKGEA